MKCVGYQFLVEIFQLRVCGLLLKSYLFEESRARTTLVDGVENRYYPVRRVTVDDTWQQNLIFAFKNEGVNLEVLKALFDRIPKEKMFEFVTSVSTGVYHRRIWFFYEFLTGNRLDIPDVSIGNYVDAIDGGLQLALPHGNAKRERRYRVFNNLVGSREFCPYVRWTDAIRSLNAAGLKGRSEELLSNYSPDVVYRAVQYLYVKETRSSFAIERETPDQKRTWDFVSLLKGVSRGKITKEALLDAQNRIVDERYAQRDWRTSQVYVGETITPTYEKVHFVAVKPQDVAMFMDGFLGTLDRALAADGMDAVVLAAVMSFAFVFIHPFDDGNGRLHRYLMHYILSRMGFSPEGMIFPVSAVLLKQQARYDRMLESFSSRLMKVLDYDIDPRGEVTVNGESADFYRFIDFTPIVEEYQKIIEETINTEWKTEIDYLVCYDRVRAEMRTVVDMPDKKANQFILFANQNGGVLSLGKRQRFFPELTDEEVAKLEAIVSEGMKLGRC